MLKQRPVLRIRCIPDDKKCQGQLTRARAESAGKEFSTKPKDIEGGDPSFSAMPRTPR